MRALFSSTLGSFLQPVRSVMRIHELPVERVLVSLKTAADGLSVAEAARRLAEFGPNRVEEVGR